MKGLNLKKMEFLTPIEVLEFFFAMEGWQTET